MPYRAGNVRLLRPLVATTKQQHDAMAGHRVIHALARPHIDAQFPHAVTAELVIAEIAKLDPCQPADYRHFRLAVAQPLQPIQIRIPMLARRQIVLDSIVTQFRL
jgi:hypothetical protein